MRAPLHVFLVVSLLPGLVAAAGPVAPPGSQTRIAFLTSDVSCARNEGYRALVEGLRSLGYREGANAAFDCRSAEGRYAQLDGLAAALVEGRPSVLVAAAAPASIAAKRATSSVPIVSVYTVDPVGIGLAANLARPGSNVTGISALSAAYAAKWLQLLKEVAPRASRVGVLGHRANPSYAIYRHELEAAASPSGVTLEFAPVETAAEIEAALARLHARPVDALLVLHQPFTFDHRVRIVEQAGRLRLPAVYGSREAVEAGGLISYAVSIEDTFRRAAGIVDRIVRGARPADIPFEQPTRFELAVNLSTAESLGLTVPASLRVRADFVYR